MGNRRSEPPRESKQKTTKKEVLFYRFLKRRTELNANAQEKNAFEIINRLRNYTSSHPNLQSNSRRAMPVAEDISSECGFERSFRISYGKIILNFYIVNEDEIFATFGKKDSPANAKVKSKDGLYISDFTIEFFSFFYMNIRDNIVAVMQGSRIPNIRDVFVDLCQFADSNFEYELPFIIDNQIWDRFGKARAVDEVSIRIATPSTKLLKKKVFDEGELAVITGNKFLLTEARLVFEPQIKTKRALSSMIVGLSKALQYEHKSKNEMSVKFVDDECQEGIVRSVENMFGKTIVIPVDQKVSPLTVYTVMKSAYNENRTSVLENVYCQDVRS